MHLALFTVLSLLAATAVAQTPLSSASSETSSESPEIGDAVELTFNDTFVSRPGDTLRIGCHNMMDTLTTHFEGEFTYPRAVCEKFEADLVPDGHFNYTAAEGLCKADEADWDRHHCYLKPMGIPEDDAIVLVEQFVVCEQAREKAV